MAKDVASVVGAPEGDAPPRDADKASAAIESLVFTDKEGKPEESPPPREREAKPKRRTKAELEAEVARLESEAQARAAHDAANAPNIIEAMEAPLSLTFHAVGGIMSAWKGPHWSFDDKECSLLAKAWAPCIGPLLAKHPEAVVWASAIAVTYSVAYPRIQQDKTLALAAAKRDGEEPDSAEVVEE